MKPVVCVETGARYESMKEASEAIGRTISALSACLKGRTKTCNNMHWKFAEE